MVTVYYRGKIGIKISQGVRAEVWRGPNVGLPGVLSHGVVDSTTTPGHSVSQYAWSTAKQGDSPEPWISAGAQLHTTHMADLLSPVPPEGLADTFSH